MSPDSNEYCRTVALFKQSLPEVNTEDIRVERIQNKLLWQRYLDCAKRMNEYNDGRLGEKYLFHGTRSHDPKLIYEGDSGFDMRCSRKGAWGEGNYFAVNASYSNNYAHPIGHNRKQMLLASVLTGYPYPSPSNVNLRKPPERPSRSRRGNLLTRRYDSVCNANLTIYITYENDRACPMYLITYKT